MSLEDLAWAYENALDVEPSEVLVGQSSGAGYELIKRIVTFWDLTRSPALRRVYISRPLLCLGA